MPYPMIRADTAVNNIPRDDKQPLKKPVDVQLIRSLMDGNLSLPFSSPVTSASMSFPHASPSPSHSLLSPTHDIGLNNLAIDKNILIFASKAVPSREIFKEPVGKTANFQWKPETLTKEEMTLLFWHRLFGHASLCHIRRLIKKTS